MVKLSVEYSERFKIISNVYGLKTCFYKSMNQVDVHNLLVKIFDELVAVACSSVKAADDWLTIFFDKFPSRPFSRATIHASSLILSMLFETLEKNMQSNDIITVNGLWESGVVISTFSDGVVTRRKNKQGVDRYDKLYRNVNFDEAGGSDDDEESGLPEKHSRQLRLGVMQIETNGKVGGMTDCCFCCAFRMKSLYLIIK